jgi:hypothetical protein
MFEFRLFAVINVVSRHSKEMLTGRMLFECKKYFSLAAKSAVPFILTIKGYRT